MSRTKIPIHGSLAIKNSEWNRYFSYSRKKINLDFHIHFFKNSVFFAIHVISLKYTLISNYYKNRRRLKRNQKKATGHACRSSKDTCARFYCFQRARGHLMKNRIQFGPVQNNMYLITQWTVYRCNHN